MKRLICRILGHVWSDPTRIDGTLPITYRSACHRCGELIFGDWNYMEAHGAWKHYR